MPGLLIQKLELSRWEMAERVGFSPLEYAIGNDL